MEVFGFKIAADEEKSSGKRMKIIKEFKVINITTEKEKRMLPKILSKLPQKLQISIETEGNNKL